jgi:AraC family transcriptional activator of pobA
MPDNKFILGEIKKTLQRNAGTNVIDLDKEFNHEFDFFINRAEDVFKLMNWNIPPIKWSYYRISFLTQGSGDMITGIYKFKSQKNMLVITPARVITTSKDWSHDTKGFVLMFNLDFFLHNNFPHKFIADKKILQASIKPYLVVNKKHAKELMNIFATIYTESETTRNHKNELIALKIIELLILSERLFADEHHFYCNLPAKDIVKKFINLVERNFLKERSVGFYAAELNVHPNHLNSLVKKYVGVTAKDSIQSRIILETKYLLHSTDLSIKEISNQLGFDDPNYFTVFFKNSEKMSPISYRASFV